jgi:hypothetical protein
MHTKNRNRRLEMEFSTELREKMGKIIAGEMIKIMPEGQHMCEVEKGMRDLLRQVGAEALSQYLGRVDEAEELEKEKACICQGKQEYLFRREAVILSVFGRVRYKRRYYACSRCGTGHSPLDRKMKIAAGEVTAGLAELLALAGIETAFAESSRFIERFLLFRVSENTLRKETEQFGQLQKEREEAWKEQSQNGTWLQEHLRKQGKQAGRLYGSIDGVMAPCKREWRELKNIAWYEVEKVRSYEKRRHHASVVGEQNDLQARNITYRCDIQPADLFGSLFWATVFVCDGAVWIWKLIERYFPHAVQIVDWYHASEYLPPIAEAVFGKDTAEYITWLEQARALLWDGQIEALIHDCQLFLNTPAAQKSVEAAVSYFTHNQKRMDYARFRQQGYFIGSGTVESAGKQIAGLRLKRAGARWTEAGAVATAKARAAWLSDHWDDLAARRADLHLLA